MTRLGLALIAFLVLASPSFAEEKTKVSTETWLTLRALAAETQALEERINRLNAEFSTARRDFAERRAELERLANYAAKQAGVEAPPICVPDTKARIWVQRDGRPCEQKPASVESPGVEK